MDKSSLLANIRGGIPIPFVGIYDTFSASLATEQFSTLFVSGYGFAASHYGMPDIGFIAWTDLLNFVQRLRFAQPQANFLVDIDDGYCDNEVARHVALQMEQLGAFGVVLEDQKRPRRCGHVGGKQILPLPDYLKKLKGVLETTNDLFVVARTDAQDPEEVLERPLCRCPDRCPGPGRGA
jgi:2-methylisocitrate lyase-like PEP mutase family enzyme